MEEATETYYRTLRGSPGAEYLESRGLSGASAMAFRLGYVAEPLPGHEAFTGRVCIPYLTRAGATCLKFRSTDDTRPKYYFQPGVSGRRLFNPAALFQPGNRVAICEGEFDAIICKQVGIPAVGIPGVDNWVPHMARCFSGYEEVLILADNDDSDGEGVAMGKRIAAAVPGARVITMPKGHDVNSYYLAHGADALRAKAGGW